MQPLAVQTITSSVQWLFTRCYFRLTTMELHNRYEMCIGHEVGWRNYT